MKAISKQSEKTFRAAIALVKEQAANGIETHWKIDDGRPYMPLCVEHVGKTQFKSGGGMLDLWSFAHYYEQNGDMMRDPDIVMMDAGGELYPISFRQDGLNLENPVREFVIYDDLGRIAGFYPRAQADCVRFCTIWARNLKDQQNLKG